MHIKLFSFILFSACFMSLLSSCGETVGGPVEKGLVTLKVTLPQDEVYDMDSPVSRGGTPVSSEGDESKIATLKFFIFNGTTNALEEYRSIAIADDNTSTDPMWDAATRTLRITVTTGDKKIYCLANWTDNSAEGMPAITDAITTLAGLTAQTRTHNNSLVLKNPPVMTGFLETTITGNELSLAIPLKRQVARVELAFKLSDVLSIGGTANIIIGGVEFLKLPSVSYVFPQSAVVNPAGVTLWGQTVFTGTTSDPLTGTAVKYATKYYLPENAPLVGNATVMVIKALYNNTTTYYSIVLNPAESATYPHTAYAIERNHTYQYTITVEGIGEENMPTRSAASGSAGITYQLAIK